MLTIYFTADDLARTRLQPTLGPLSETVFAIGLLQEPVGRAHHLLRRGLVRRHRGGQPDRLPMVREAVPEHLLKLMISSASVRTAVPDEATLARVRRLWGAAIAPHWDRISGHLAAEVEWRARLAVGGGVERLLSTLHTKVTWSAPRLTVEGPEDAEVRLGGRGLVLVPSVFLAHRHAVLVPGQDADDTPALVFAAPPADAENLLGADPVRFAPQALGALVGQTRAAVLRELVVASSNTELADRLGISSAGVSQHASVLRGAGLVATRRFRNRAFHTVTPLGRALLSADAQRLCAGGPAEPGLQRSQAGLGSAHAHDR